MTRVMAINNGEAGAVSYDGVPDYAKLHIVVIYGKSYSRVNHSYVVGWDISSSDKPFYTPIPSVTLSNGSFACTLVFNHNTKNVSIDKLEYNGIDVKYDSTTRFYVGWSYA